MSATVPRPDAIASSAVRRVATILLAVALAGCVHTSSSVRAPRKINYWAALAELHASEAVAAARTDAEREFAQALGDLMAGEIEKAERKFGQLRTTAADSLIRAGSRVIYTATLQYQEKWVELAALSAERGVKPGDETNKASIELWATAFRNLPPKTCTFRARSAVLPMLMSEVGTPLVPVRIGGRVYNFWLDTGSSMTMIASDVARELHIAPLIGDTLEIITSTGRVKAHPSLVTELEIGQVVVRNAPTMIVDEAFMTMRDLNPLELATRIKIDGIIGFDIIRQLDLEVDYGGRELHLRDPAASRATNDRNMFWVGLPVIRMSNVDGTLLAFGLDTGAQSTFVTETLLYKLELETARIERRRVGGLGGEVSLRMPIVPDLRVLVRGYPIIFKDAVVRAPVYQVLAALDGVLGGDVWSSGVVRIDMTHGIFAVRRSTGM